MCQCQYQYQCQCPVQVVGTVNHHHPAPQYNSRSLYDLTTNAVINAMPCHTVQYSPLYCTVPPFVFHFRRHHPANAFHMISFLGHASCASLWSSAGFFFELRGLLLPLGCGVDKCHGVVVVQAGLALLERSTGNKIRRGGSRHLRRREAVSDRSKSCC